MNLADAVLAVAVVLSIATFVGFTILVFGIRADDRRLSVAHPPRGVSGMAARRVLLYTRDSRTSTPRHPVGR
ncbi:hypothetical protein [Spongiactinospora sp. 9N601]|uniref:hypothetical protein n=1 Tax=Spongiactinospora sp. 9N601 TaxID=3375149 RepID=UPI0037933BBD